MSGWYLSKEPSHEYIRELNSPPVRHRGKPQKAIRGQKKGTTMFTCLHTVSERLNMHKGEEGEETEKVHT